MFKREKIVPTEFELDCMSIYNILRRDYIARMIPFITEAFATKFGWQPDSVLPTENNEFLVKKGRVTLKVTCEDSKIKYFYTHENDRWQLPHEVPNKGTLGMLLMEDYPEYNVG